MVALVLFAGNLMAQNQWFPLHDSGLDTLTGVAADSTLEEVSLKLSILVARQTYRTSIPKAILIVTEYADIADGEGVTQRDGVGDNLNDHYSGFTTLDTLATAPSAADTYTTINIETNPGDAYKYSLKAYASAADTDSLTVRRYIYGIY